MKELEWRRRWISTRSTRSPLTIPNVLKHKVASKLAHMALSTHQIVLTQIPTPGQPRMNNQNQGRSSSCFSSSPCVDPASLPDSKNPEPIEFIRKTSCLLICAFHAFSACGKQKKQNFEKHCLLGKSNPSGLYFSHTFLIVFCHHRSTYFSF